MLLTSAFPLDDDCGEIVCDPLVVQEIQNPWWNVYIMGDVQSCKLSLRFPATATPLCPLIRETPEGPLRPVRSGSRDRRG